MAFHRQEEGARKREVPWRRRKESDPRGERGRRARGSHELTEGGDEVTRVAGGDVRAPRQWL
jgi:hypothetical protein